MSLPCDHQPFPIRGPIRIAADLLRSESDNPLVCEAAACLRDVGVERLELVVMLARFIGLAQERTWPGLETINEARKVLGMHELTELPGNI